MMDKKQGGHMNVEDWRHGLSTLFLTGVSAVLLFKAAGMQPLTGPSASVASWVIFCVCAYGLQKIYEALFDIVAGMVKRNTRAVRGDQDETAVGSGGADASGRGVKHSGRH
jgi:hypothetical protein